MEVFHLLRAPLGACSRTIATNCFPSTESLIGEEAIVAPVWEKPERLARSRIDCDQGRQRPWRQTRCHRRCAARPRQKSRERSGTSTSPRRSSYQWPAQNSDSLHPLHRRPGRVRHLCIAAPPQRPRARCDIPGCGRVPPRTARNGRDQRGLCQLDPPTPVDPCRPL